jgi:hypothetical protein
MLVMTVEKLYMFPGRVATLSELIKARLDIMATPNKFEDIIIGVGMWRNTLTSKSAMELLDRRIWSHRENAHMRDIVGRIEFGVPKKTT